QLISAENYSSALRMLEEMGWIESEDREDIDAALKRHGMRVWELLNEVSPNISVLDFLIIKNDFHNIKAALKSFVTMHVTGGNQVLTDSFVSPSIVYPEMIKNALSLKKYDELPDFVQDAINKTYDVLIRTLDGQLADIILDSLALNCIAERAENTGNDFIIKTAELMCVTANIKIAYRATRTGKGREFLETALCVTKTLDKRQLLEASLEGMQELIAYIESTPYKDAAAYLAESASAFEKWCDDL
ncbi:MAG TPA: hypothetical protein DD733_12770, partial [Clostridiales bacterium]|nr:hypothetical protein [Clostridiales bacterium]